MAVSAAPRRGALILFGLALGVLALEAMLQLGALVVWARGSAPTTAWPGGRQRILCLGDSNTYGLYLADRGDAYPQQLERLWNADPSRPPIEVLNLGYPGTNSSKLVHDLPRMLDTLRPDVVILMVGSNDFWTAPVPPPSAAGRNPLVAMIRRYSRTYQLIHMLGRAFDHRQLQVHYPVTVDGGSSGTARFGDVEFSLGWQRGAIRGDAAYAELEQNLRTLAETIRAHGAEPIFLTYGSGMWNYGDASRAMRRAAAANDVPLIDAAAPIATVCPAEPCPQWLYEDHHPTAAGYRLMAEAVVQGLTPP